MNTPLSDLQLPAYYQARIEHLNLIIESLQRRSRLISNARLSLFLLALFLIYYTWSSSWAWSVIISVIALSLFIWLVRLARSSETSLDFQKTLLAINKEEALSLENKFHHKPDGSKYLVGWAIDNDLDRFGSNSLFQFINRAETYQGHESMAKSLIDVPSTELLQSRQEAIKELMSQVDWRQKFRAHTLQNSITQQSQQILKHWISNSEQAALPRFWSVLVYLLPVLSILATLAYSFDILPRVFFYSYLILAFIVAVYFGKIANEWFKHLNRIILELNTLLPAIAMIEENPVQHALLKDLQVKVIHPDKVSFSLKKLSKILARYDYRLNPVVYIPLNFFLWWDLRQVLALYQWRKSHQGDTDQWFEVIGQMEYLCSYANLAFNHPAWVFPSISNRWHGFKANDIGHPLIPKSKAITNDFSLSDPQRVALITGSNMAGKSTFLRSIGANVLIAMAGGPVFAKACTLSPGRILSSMRISDNLQEETSTFYAELKKIKIILDAVKSGEKVLVLIDEMLRGTNTLDREQGARALVRQLIAYHAVAIVASHDTGLGQIQATHPEVVDNYYFDSIIEDEILRFDYKIKRGVCTQTNASYLMKKMGIDV